MDKRKSETLSQREKAQRDLLELKKMQAGEIEPPKPEEHAPLTKDEKRENFFYYHKYKLIAAGLALIFATYFIVNSLNKVNYDAKMVIFSFNYITEEQSNLSDDYFEGYFEDINGNGSVDIQSINCSFQKNGSNSQYAGSMLTKIQTVLVGEDDTMLFILDKDSLDFLNGISDEVTLFSEESVKPLPESFYKAIGLQDKELFLCIRAVEGTTMEGKNEKQYNAAKKVFDAF